MSVCHVWLAGRSWPRSGSSSLVLVEAELYLLGLFLAFLLRRLLELLALLAIRRPCGFDWGVVLVVGATFFEAQQDRRCDEQGEEGETEEVGAHMIPCQSHPVDRIAAQADQVENDATQV